MMNDAVSEVVVKWLMLNSVESNADLARVSNVCRLWRRIVSNVLLDDTAVLSPSLLLPSLIRQHSFTTFCAAWFAPELLQYIPIHHSQQTLRRSSDEYSWFTPNNESGISSYRYSDDEKKSKRRTRVRSKSPAPLNHFDDRNADDPLCGCYEWKGYQTAVEVLTPFGYAPHFVESLRLDGAEAVRGAVLARPEGYCLCWDTHTNEERIHQKQHLQETFLPRTIHNGTSVCLQFLNADGSHAVRMLTPPFGCGPLNAPLTMFCVAVATEDGCFLSGLRHRLEFGHLYPKVPTDMDMSSICLAVDTLHQSNVDTNHPAGYLSDDSSCDDRSSSSMPDCTCCYRGMMAPNADDSDQADEEDTPRSVYRGRLGPGAWHCYVAVVDGIHSQIRIDGNLEPLELPPNPPEKQVVLDGLTIGADHGFDMSLCFGEGSDGEGQGAIAELAVFQGRLANDDLQVLEAYFMNKHGIPAPSETHVEDDFYSRQAAQMLLAPIQRNVPLRYMARQRSVAWRQTNPVTGNPIIVSRIGCKKGEESSDW